MNSELQAKLDKLKAYLKGLGSLAVGFSGGVDSTFLISVAHEVLGDRALAVTEADAAVPGREVNEAKEFCESRGIRHITFTVDPLTEKGYRKNSSERCYYCKRLIFREIRKIAEENGIGYVAEGSNMDDLGDYRPGLRAAAELGITAPLREAGLTKSDIRELSKEMGLPTWSKPSYACLASRFAYGEKITTEGLIRVANAEKFIRDLGFRGIRVRVHGNLARIEVAPDDKGRFLLKADEVTARLKELGFSYVTMDLKGYRTGSMNEVLG